MVVFGIVSIFHFLVGQVAWKLSELGPAQWLITSEVGEVDMDNFVKTMTNMADQVSTKCNRMAKVINEENLAQSQPYPTRAVAPNNNTEFSKKQILGNGEGNEG